MMKKLEKGFTPIVDFDIVSSKWSRALMPKFNTGFTLIELLVVIAIIGMLSSIILSSLNGARNKAKDATIKEEVFQLANLMTLNYDDYKSYCQLQSGWVSNDGACSTIFTGTYASQARQICSNIYNNARDLNKETSACLAGACIIYSNTTVGCATAYSFMVGLNNGKWYCSGSSGAKGEYSSYVGQPGCSDNP